jgi:Tol biopolymer transport system component
MRTQLVLLTIAATLAALLVATGARATYPGANGRLAFGMTADGNTDVYSVLPNGDALRRLTDDPRFDACAAYSADGKWIAWCGPGGIWLMKQNGTDKRQLTTFGAFPDISPDGSKVVFSGSPTGSTNVDVWTVAVATGSLTRLRTEPGPDRFAAWSPDGMQIVYQSPDPLTGIEQVWLMNNDGSDPTQLTFDPASKDQVPDWSPDGAKIAYVENVPGRRGGDIWVIDADGANPHPVTSGIDLLGTAWSPDGTQIATLNWTTRTVEIMNADGSDLHPVHAGGIQFVPGWQPHSADDADADD